MLYIMYIIIFYARQLKLNKLTCDSAKTALLSDQDPWKPCFQDANTTGFIKS